MHTNKKRLVHIISSLKIGGAESLLVDLLSELFQYEHHVVYFHDGPNRARLERVGVKTYQLKGLLCCYDPFFFVRLLLIVRKLKPDCLHSALWAANFAGRIVARVLRVPLVSVVHLGVHQDGKLRNAIDNFSFRAAKKIVAVSDEVARSLQKKGWIAPENISVVPNGIGGARVRAESKKHLVQRTEFAIPQDSFVIGSVGRFIERKNFPLLLRSFAKLTEQLQKKVIHLALVGVGPLESELRMLAERLHVNKHVCFILGRPAYGLYPLFDCFVLPSLHEGMSIALLEAMCFALPCIVTGLQKHHEVISNRRNGLIIAPNDEAVLADTMRKLILDKQLAKQLGACAKDTIEKSFSIKKMAQSYKIIFDREIQTI